VNVSDVDGDKLTDQALSGLLEDLTEPYVRDRFENP